MSCACTAVVMLVVGVGLVHTLGGSQRSVRGVVQNSCGSCVGNGVLGPMSSATVCGVKVWGGEGSSEVDGTYPDSKSWVPISVVSELSSHSYLLRPMVLAMFVPAACFQL